MELSAEKTKSAQDRQIGRYKGKHRDRAWAGAEEVAGGGEELPVELELEESVGRIVRTKSFRMVSINPEEAIEQMELLGHDFYVFFTNPEKTPRPSVSLGLGI